MTYARTSTPINRAELEPLLRDFAVSTYTAQMQGVSNLASHDSFIEHQVFDSMTLMSFIRYIERVCAIAVPAEDIVPENFDSIDRIMVYLHTRARVS